MSQGEVVAGGLGLRFGIWDGGTVWGGGWWGSYSLDNQPCDGRCLQRLVKAFEENISLHHGLVPELEVILNAVRGLNGLVGSCCDR